MRTLILIISVLLLAACRHTGTSSSSIPVIPTVAVQQTRTVSDFNNIAAQGRINLVLHTGYRQPQIILKGAPSDLAQVSTRVENHNLVINLGSGFPRCGPVTVEVRTRFLNTLRYQGGGLITGKNLHSGLLDLFIENEGRTVLGGHLNVGVLEVKGNGYTEITGIQARKLHLKISDKSKVKLRGIAKICSLNLEGNAALSLYWVKADSLIIKARGQAFMQLAGIVNKMDLTLFDSAHFSGRYLRAKRAFVKTYGKSLAKISSVDRQHTLASDASDIYFYNVPTMKTDFMAFNGAVLDMREWGDFEMQEYDRYNKQLQ